MEIIAGLGNRELALWTGWTADTVETYLKGLYAKLQVHSRAQATRLAIDALLEHAFQGGGQGKATREHLNRETTADPRRAKGRARGLAVLPYRTPAAARINSRANATPSAKLCRGIRSSLPCIRSSPIGIGIPVTPYTGMPALRK